MKYPESFYNTKQNTKVDDQMIQEMIEHGIRIIERDQVAHTTVSTGNVLVLVTKMHEEDGGGIHVVVASDYKEHYIGNEIFSK